MEADAARAELPRTGVEAGAPPDGFPAPPEGLPAGVDAAPGSWGALDWFCSNYPESLGL